MKQLAPKMGTLGFQHLPVVFSKYVVSHIWLNSEHTRHEMGRLGVFGVQPAHRTETPARWLGPDLMTAVEWEQLHLGCFAVPIMIIHCGYELEVKFLLYHSFCTFSFTSFSF